LDFDNTKDILESVLRQLCRGGQRRTKGRGALAAARQSERDAAADPLARIEYRANRILALYAAGDEESLPVETVKSQLSTIEAERKVAATRLDAAERALAESARRRIDLVGSIDSALARVSQNVKTLDFAGRRMAVEALVGSVTGGKDPVSWRMDVVIPVSGDGIPFASSRSPRLPLPREGSLRARASSCGTEDRP
jgi:hypothetical protein